MTPNAKGIALNNDERARHSTSKVYFACPKFTVLLVLNGEVIVNAAPVVRAFEGQTIGALTSWALAKFGAPIRVERIA